MQLPFCCISSPLQVTYIQTRAEQMDTATLQRGSPCVGMIHIWVYIGRRDCPQSAHIHSVFPGLSEPYVTLATSSWSPHRTLRLILDTRQSRTETTEPMQHGKNEDQMRHEGRLIPVESVTWTI